MLSEADIEKLEDRMRGAEKSSAVMEANIQTLFKRLDDIKSQIQDFITRADMVMTCRQEINQLSGEIKSLNDWRSSHTQEYTTLISEHRLYCQKSEKTETWWQQRAGRLLDWAVPAIVVYLLLLYKSGGHP